MAVLLKDIAQMFGKLRKWWGVVGGGIILYDLFLCSKRLKSTIATVFWWFLKYETHLYNLVYTHTIHVWFIYLHLVDYLW